MTVQVDITNIRQKGYKLYPTMLYCLATQVNRHEEFRMNIRPGGQLVCYDVLHPSYTVFHRESETFFQPVDFVHPGSSGLLPPVCPRPAGVWRH